MWYNRKVAQNKFINKLYFVDRVKEDDMSQSFISKITNSIIERYDTIKSNEKYNKDEKKQI